MLIANKKLKSNIAEYVLYMWQLEDTIRACDFKMDLIEERIISQFKQPDSVMEQIRNWYADLVLAMHEEGLRDKGHISFVISRVNDLYELHKKLILTQRDQKYLSIYQKALPNIQAFGEKLNKPASNEIDVCFQALYAMLLLRLQKKTISEETMKAMKTFSDLLSMLSEWYRKVEEGTEEL